MKLTNLTKEEQKAISSWTSIDGNQYRSIKEIIAGEYEGSLKSYYAPQANTLLELFDKYEDNTSDVLIYRGDVLEDKKGTLNDKDIYEQYLSKNPIGKCIFLGNSMLSCTTLEKIAIKSYTNSSKNIRNSTPTILYIITKRKSIFLDISEYSKLPHEKEVLCNKGIKFKVMDIKEDENNHLVYILEECEENKK